MSTEGQVCAAGGRRAVWPFRRLCQVAVLAVLVLVPWFSSNPGEWAPSRIVLGQMPQPALLPVSGDTWAFELFGFRLVHPVAFAENWLASRVLYLPLLSAVIVPLAVTVLLGRVFCSWLCPVGMLLEWNERLGQRLARSGRGGWRFPAALPDLRYAFLAFCLALAFFFAMPVIALFDPPHVLGRELMSGFTHREFSRLGLGVLAGVTVLDLVVVRRAWCRLLCPSGGGLALLGRWRVWRIAMAPERCTRCQACDHACPYGLAPMSLAGAGERGERFDWTTCDNCGRCRDACPTGALAYRLAGGRGAGVSRPCRPEEN